MSLNPFRADPAIAARIAELTARVGADVAAEVTRLALAGARDPETNLGGMVVRSEVERLVAHYGLASVEDLMLLALLPARGLAEPPISSFFVGAVGLEHETGHLILGGNLEFPATHLGYTVHGEGFVLTRAASRGSSISVLAIGEAHPCAHCRQYLSEFAPSQRMALIDPLGHRLSMAELYPWPFDPDYLGEAGYHPGPVLSPGLKLAGNSLDHRVAHRLLRAGQRAHAPYSKAPGAVVLSLADGGYICGFAIESVAFNPSMGPLQAALIDLAAHGRSRSEITAAALGTVIGGAVDYSRSTAELLASIAPGVRLDIVGWA